MSLAAIEEVILEVLRHNCRTQQVTGTQLRVFRQFIQHTFCHLFAGADVSEHLRLILGRINHMHMAQWSLRMAVASSSSLRDGIQPRCETDHRTEIDINASLNQLRADAKNRFLSIEVLDNPRQAFFSVG